MSNDALMNAKIAFAQYLLGAGRLDAARDELFALQGASGPLALAVFNELGSALFAAERYADAETAFKRALDVDPMDAEAGLGLGYALFNRNLLAEAQRAFAALTGRGAGGSVAWRGMAAVELNSQNYGAARSALEQAIAADPKDAEALALTGLCAYREAKADLAWRDWTRHNLVAPTARPNVIEGRVPAQALEEALAALEEARRINAAIRTEELAARLLTVSGRPEAARDFLAATPDPDARTYQLMADVCWLLRDERAAKDYLRQALSARAEPRAELRPLGQDLEAIPTVAKGLERHGRETPGAVPVVWLHWDAPPHFMQSVASVLAASPSTPLVILGDASNAIRPCLHLPMTRYCASAWEFLERYRHASENDFVYEAFCFLRWFILKDWMQSAGVAHVVAIDSDILLFADVERDLMPRLMGKDLAFTGPLGPHFTILSRQGLSDLCDFFMTAYERGVPDLGGQVTDMTLLPSFLKGRDWADLSQEDGAARVDGNLRLSEGLRMADKVKEIRFEEGRAYAQRADGQGRTRLLALHFQGTAKPLMLSALMRRDITV